MTHSRYKSSPTGALVALRVFDSLGGVPPKPPESLRSETPSLQSGQYRIHHMSPALYAAAVFCFIFFPGRETAQDLPEKAK